MQIQRIKRNNEIICQVKKMLLFFFVCVCIIMSSEAEILTKERKITVKTYIKNTVHSICV